MRLVSDIGGTNARLALYKAGAIVPQTVRNFSNDDRPHLYDIITAYLNEHAPVQLDDMVVAVVGLVHGDQAVLTNWKWTGSPQAHSNLKKCLRSNCQEKISHAFRNAYQQYKRD